MRGLAHARLAPNSQWAGIHPASWGKGYRTFSYGYFLGVGGFSAGAGGLLAALRDVGQLNPTLVRGRLKAAGNRSPQSAAGRSAQEVGTAAECDHARCLARKVDTPRRES